MGNNTDKKITQLVFGTGGADLDDILADTSDMKITKNILKYDIKFRFNIINQESAFGFGKVNIKYDGTFEHNFIKALVEQPTIGVPSSFSDPSTLSDQIALGGSPSNDLLYYNIYLKYKEKYIQLKNKLK